MILFPADCKEWDNVVCRAYPVKKYIHESDNLYIKLYTPDIRPTFFTNAPYLEEGGVLIKEKTKDINLDLEMSNLFEEYDLNYILLKTRDRLFSEKLIKENVDDTYYTFLLDTTLELDKLWKKKLKAKTRNQIRKAEKNCFHIQFGHFELLNDFYNVISRCWRDLGTPAHSYFFFKSILEEFKESTRIIIVFDKKIPVSAALLFNINSVLSHPFAGTIKSYKPTSVNNLLYWNIIKYACAHNNISTFDMGRSRLNQGTYHFKKSWGGEAENIYYYYYLREGIKRPSYDSLYYRYATSMWKKMPLRFANRLGPKLIYKIL